MVRVAVIGLDGAPYEFISSIMDEGGLRNFRELVRHGVAGVLRSTIPPVSPVAWASISTGLNPGKHGVFGFVDRAHRPYSSRNIMGLALWDLLALARKRSLCINVPFTYPPYRVRGAMVSGPPCPRDQPSTYPPGLEDELEELGYRIDVRLPYGGYRGVREAVFFKDCLSGRRPGPKPSCAWPRSSSGISCSSSSRPWIGSSTSSSVGPSGKARFMTKGGVRP